LDIVKEMPAPKRKAIVKILAKDKAQDIETRARHLEWYQRWIQVLDYEGKDRPPRSWKDHYSLYVGPIQRKHPAERITILAARQQYEHYYFRRDHFTFDSKMKYLRSPPRLLLAEREPVNEAAAVSDLLSGKYAYARGAMYMIDLEGSLI
jgi:hypothetical protein